MIHVYVAPQESTCWLVAGMGCVGDVGGGSLSYVGRGCGSSHMVCDLSPPASSLGGQGLAQNLPATDEPEEALSSGAQQGPGGQSRGKGRMVASVLLLVKRGQECLPGQGPLCRPSQPQGSAPAGSPQPSSVGIRREWNSRLGGWCSQCEGPGAHRPLVPALASALNLLISFPGWGSRLA